MPREPFEVPLHVLLTLSMSRTLDQAAARNAVSVSSYVRLALAEALRRER